LASPLLTYQRCTVIEHKVSLTSYSTPMFLVPMSREAYRAVVDYVRFFLAPCVYPSPSAKEGPGAHSGESVLVHKKTSPRRSRKLTVWNSAGREMIQCTSEDMRIVVHCWHYGQVEHCIRQGVAYLHTKTPKGHTGASIFCLIQCYIYLLY